MVKRSEANDGHCLLGAKPCRFFLSSRQLLSNWRGLRDRLRSGWRKDSPTRVPQEAFRIPLSS